MATVASSARSFNHSRAFAVGSDAQADDSAILGGEDNNIDAASLRSVALGGQQNNIVNETDLAQAQNLRITTDFRITKGADKPVGTATLNGTGTTVVNNSIVKTGAIILLTTEQEVGGFFSALSAPKASIVDGVSFTILSESALDTSTVNYLIINP